MHSTQLAVVRRLAARTFAAALLLGALSCTSYRVHRDAQLAEGREAWDEAVVKYMQLIEQEPGNVRTRSGLVRAKIRASQEHFNAGRRFAEAGVLDRALIELQQAVALDPTNQYAAVELAKVRERLTAEREHGPLPLTLDEMKKKTRDIAAQPPVLNPCSTAPISLEFPKAVSIFDIYRALGKAFGINVLFDPALKDQELAIELREVTAQTALETLMCAAGHFYKVIDERSIIIAADNPQNRKNYEDLVIQTFFLSNAEVKDVLTLLRSLIGAKNIATNEQLNAVTIRDTADKVKVAQKMIEGIDKSKSEVIVDVKLIEVDTNKFRELGVSLSNYSVTQGLDFGGEDAKIRLNDLKFLNQNSWVLTIPNIIMAKFWLHCHYLFVDGQKMSKSKGNILYTDTLRNLGFTMSEIRFFLIYGHYRERLDYSVEHMKSPVEKVRKFKSAVRKIDTISGGNASAEGQFRLSLRNVFQKHMDNDLHVQHAFDELNRKISGLQPGELIQAEASEILKGVQEIDEVLKVIF